MTQTYRNCGSTTVTVGPYYKLSGGDIHVYNAECKVVAPGASVNWSYSITYRNAQYSTNTCVNNATGGVFKDYHTSSIACGTSFNPSSPQGAALNHYYSDCLHLANYTPVASAYRTPNGNFYVNAPGGCVTYVGYTLDYRYIAYWYYSSTVRDATYTTVYCDYWVD